MTAFRARTSPVAPMWQTSSRTTYPRIRLIRYRKLGAVAGSPFDDVFGSVSVAADPSGRFLYVANNGSAFSRCVRVCD